MVNFFNKKIDTYKLLKQTWESFAIQGEIVTGLSDILKKLIQIDLHSIAENYGIKQPSKISDMEIIARLLKLMTDRKKIEEILMIASPGEFDLFLEILDMDFMDIDQMPYESYAYTMDYGIMFSFYHQERRYLVVSEEIKDICRNINKAVFTIHRERYQLFRKYIKALCNFYGAFEPGQFINIFNTFNRDSATLAEFKKIYQNLTLKCRQNILNIVFQESPRETKSMENLARYIIRASFSQERLSYMSEASKVIYKSKKGSETKEFDAIDFIASICSHISNKNEQMVRYTGY